MPTPPNTDPLFVVTPRVYQVVIATANTSLTGSGTIGTLLTGSTNGDLVELINIKANVTTTAGMIRIFISNGSAFELYDEVSVSAATPSGTVKAFQAQYIPTRPLVIQSGFILGIATNNAEEFVITAHGGSY